MKRYSFVKLAILSTALLAPLHVNSAHAGVSSIFENPAHAPLTLHINASDEVVQGAQNFIQNVSSRGLNFLKNKNLNAAQRKDEFRKLLHDSFDLKTIARFTLGTHWRSATDSQKKEFTELFDDMVVNTYSKRFSDYQGQDIRIDKARPEGKNDAIVNSHISASDGSPSVKLDWRVRYKNGEYRIVDVLVEGVSMTLTQRSEFSSIIQRGGGNIDVLLQKLRER